MPATEFSSRENVLVLTKYLALEEAAEAVDSCVTAEDSGRAAAQVPEDPVVCSHGDFALELGHAEEGNAHMVKGKAVLWTGEVEEEVVLEVGAEVEAA